jgi:hypothetical protein
MTGNSAAAGTSFLDCGELLVQWHFGRDITNWNDFFHMTATLHVLELSVRVTDLLIYTSSQRIWTNERFGSKFLGVLWTILKYFLTSNWKIWWQPPQNEVSYVDCRLLKAFENKEHARWSLSAVSTSNNWPFKRYEIQSESVKVLWKLNMPSHKAWFLTSLTPKSAPNVHYEAEYGQEKCCPVSKIRKTSHN